MHIYIYTSVCVFCVLFRLLIFFSYAIESVDLCAYHCLCFIGHVEGKKFIFDISDLFDIKKSNNDRYYY